MMRFSEPHWLIYVCARPVDFRKGMGSLAVLVEAQLKRDPFAEALFLFSNRRFNAIKLLYWERNGFCLWQKRLEKDRFTWPKPNTADIRKKYAFPCCQAGIKLASMPPRSPKATLHPHYWLTLPQVNSSMACRCTGKAGNLKGWG